MTSHYFAQPEIAAAAADGWEDWGDWGQGQGQGAQNQQSSVADQNFNPTLTQDQLQNSQSSFQTTEPLNVMTSQQNFGNFAVDPNFNQQRPPQTIHNSFQHQTLEQRPGIPTSTPAPAQSAPEQVKTFDATATDRQSTPQWPQQQVPTSFAQQNWQNYQSLPQQVGVETFPAHPEGLPVPQHQLPVDFKQQNWQNYQKPPPNSFLPHPEAPPLQQQQLPADSKPPKLQNYQNLPQQVSQAPILAQPEVPAPPQQQFPADLTQQNWQNPQKAHEVPAASDFPWQNHQKVPVSLAAHPEIPPVSQQQLPVENPQQNWQNRPPAVSTVTQQQAPVDLNPQKLQNYQNLPQQVAPDSFPVYPETQTPPQPQLQQQTWQNYQQVAQDSFTALPEVPDPPQQQLPVNYTQQNWQIPQQASMTSFPAPEEVSSVVNQLEQNREVPATSEVVPENRERLDDLATPPAPAPASPFTDRHNYLVTGQLSQERPPPGLSRMVVGQPEQTPAGLNRMVTGTEYMNYQRQADGEVSQPPQPPRPATTHTSDRNLYLVAGESDVNSQRVIPGVESDNLAPPVTLLTPMQNLHIQDDDDFVHVQDEVREEDIDGANDNTEPVISIPEPEVEAPEVREEAIEGANDEIQSKPKTDIGLSSEDSELRALEAKSKPRRSKKYTEDSNESENEQEERRRRREKEKYRKERKPARRGDNTDGSKYSRRSEDEEDYRKYREKSKRSSRNRNPEEDEVDEKERRKREKYRSEGARKADYNYEKGRGGQRRRDPYYNDDSYSGRRSQNNSDREFGYSRRPRDAEKERNAYYQQQYPGYDYNLYYQQQQYYETLRRTNPQAYEYYTKYYAQLMQQQQLQATQLQHDDLAGSMRSGYSSSTEKDRVGRFLPGGNISNPLRSMNSSFIENHDYQSLGGGLGFSGAVKDLNQAYASMTYGSGGYGYEQRLSTARLTPKKFQSLHSFVRLTNGFMTTIDSTTVKIANLPINDKAKRLYQSFPGPLVRNVSHKKTVIEFCEEKLKSGLDSSASLLWSYLIMMLRQNGNYNEADISELLMKNSAEFKEDVKEEDEVDDVEEVSESSSSAVSTSTGDVIHKFRDYLLYGNINDALDFATENNLWGHALFLASKVDRRQHANVMLKFANKLPFNDPLQTLYQIMSGRLPACVTGLDDKWGDWRPHLAMIVSNCTDKPDLVKRAILALGESLSSRGDVCGAQFCFLLADSEFGNYSDEDARLVLLGTSHQKPFKEFASDDAIIMTEVYEFARSLSDENFFIAPLQRFKFLLAGQMLDCGMQLKCLLYCEQIAKCIVARPDEFDVNFIMKVYGLADRLKFYDPVMEKSYEDNFNNNGVEGVEDPKWLQDLVALLNYSGGYQEPAAASIYDPQSQQQSPEHQQILQQPVVYEEQPQVDNYSYQQPPPPMQDLNYSYDYNNSSATENQSQNQQQFIEQPTYDAYQQQQQQQPVENYGYGGWDQNPYQPTQTPNITLGNTSSNKFNDESENARKNSSTGESEKKNSSPVKKPEPKKTQTQEGSQSGWFGGIFSKLSMKPKNQMILPDDKNPTIVWDEATKKWVNKDGEAAEEESFKPPPKMGDMMPSQNHIQASPQMPQVPQVPQFAQQPQINQQPIESVAQVPVISQTMSPMMPVGTSQEPQQPPVPVAAPNMFKMQKGRNLKKSYVDILGSTGQTVQQKELAPQMEMQFFNPVQQQPQGMQFYNPNDFQ